MRIVGSKLNQGMVLSLLKLRRSSEGACLCRQQWPLCMVFLLHASYRSIPEASCSVNSLARIRPQDTGCASVALIRAS